MRISAVIGAAVGALIGALVWAAIASWTGLEVGYVAWGIGGLVGFGAAVLGGYGPAMGSICAVLALSSILVGKLIAIDHLAEQEIRKFAKEIATIDLYQEMVRDAEDFAELYSEDEYAEFMVTHGYTEAAYEDEVMALEIAAFKQEMVPELERLQRTKPTFDRWRKEAADEMVAEWEATGSSMEVVEENFDFLDVIFGLLGLVTAYQIGAAGILRREGGGVPFPRGTDREPWQRGEPTPGAYDRPGEYGQPQEGQAGGHAPPADPSAPASPAYTYGQDQPSGPAYQYGNDQPSGPAYTYGQNRQSLRRQYAESEPPPEDEQAP